jgi:HSP20 family molecular chaperone IbpA
MIRELGEAIGDTVVESVGRAVSRTQERRPLASDVLESDEAYLVVFDTPGARPEDVQVRYEDDTIEVRVDRFRDFHEGFEMRFPGRGRSLDGSVSLPADAAVDAEHATATLKKNGTLQIRLPKRGDLTASDEPATSVDVDADDETEVGTTDDKTVPDMGDDSEEDAEEMSPSDETEHEETDRTGHGGATEEPEEFDDIGDADGTQADDEDDT